MRARATWAVFALAVVLYLPSFTHGYVDWDDAPVIKAALELSAFDLAALRRAFFSFELGTWQPAGWLLYAGLARLAGPAPFVYHFAAALLHALAAAAVTRLAFKRLGDPYAAALAGAAFAWHPLAVDAVASAANLGDLWTTTLALWTFALYEEGRGRAALAAFALACLGRWQAFPVPAGLALLDWSARRPVKLKKLAPYFALSAAVVFVYAFVKAQNFGTGGTPPSPVPALYGLAFYGKQWFWPAVLLHDYRLDLGEGLMAALALACAAGAWVFRERSRGLAASLAFFALAPLPTFLPTLEGRVYGHDRYVYLACAPLFVCAAWAAKRYKGAGAVVACLWVGALGARAARRLDAWSDPSTFWRAALAAEPERPDVLLCLGMAELKNGRPHEAVDIFKRLDRKNPAAGRPFLEMAKKAAK